MNIFLEAHVGAPVDPAQVVALMKLAVLQKFLTAAGKARTGYGRLPGPRKSAANGW